MRLRTKLTLLFACVLLVMAGVLLAALRLVSGIAAESTAKSTLESTLSGYADKIEYENGQLKALRNRSYSEGAYIQVFSADGTELLAGTDVFEIAGLMPELLQEQETGQVFQLDTGEESVYCYILWKQEKQKGKKRNGKQGLSGKMTDTGETLSGEAFQEGTVTEETVANETALKGEKTKPSGQDEPGGVWIVGILPEDSMENVMASVERQAWIGLPFIVLLAALGGWVITGRSLRPLQMITESAREISDGHDLSRRIELAPGRDEVHELADTFNDMMGRLERSFDAERQFTSDASHELRTPTAVILAECEMAEKMPGDAEAAQESIQEIHRQAKKMSELIGKLLSYTRLEQGTRRIDREKLDLSELVEDVCEEQRTVAGRGITIESEIEPGVIVEGDMALLISLVQNLVSNAVKYGKDGGHVFVRVYQENRETRRPSDKDPERKNRQGAQINCAQTSNACVLVRDDGIGISAEDLERIWSRFYQADRSRSDEARGVGLGLSLAQQIARLHGGMITAESRPGEGSSFLFTMPARSGA